MLRLTIALALCACSGVPDETPTSEPVIEADADYDAGHDAGADAGAPDAGPETVSVASVQARMGAVPYRDPRYLRRCAAQARRAAPVATSMESKDDARLAARQAARQGELDAALLLARIAYGETGTPLPGHNDDPATPLWDEAHAFLAVLDHRRGDMSREEMFVAYSPRRVFPHPEDARQRWVAELQLDGRRPPSWPRPRGRRHHSYPTWRHYGCPRWLATVDAVRRLLREAPERVGAGPCASEPDHWGGEVGVDDHAVALGWRLVDCGVTRNRFWSVPSD